MAGALTKETFTGGVKDLKIFPITKDDATGYTVGTAVDIPAAQSFKVDYEFDSKELFGDEEIQDIWSKIKKANVSIEYGKTSLDLEAALLGGTVTTSGSTPNQVQSQGVTLGTLSNYFQIAFKSDYVDKLGNAADMHVYVMKCKVTADSFDSSSEEYGKLSFDAEGINTKYDFSTKGKALQRQIHETNTDLTAVVSA